MAAESTPKLPICPIRTGDQFLPLFVSSPCTRVGYTRALRNGGIGHFAAYVSLPERIRGVLLCFTPIPLCRLRILHFRA